MDSGTPKVRTSKRAIKRADSVSALERGFSVLRCFAADAPALTHQEITRLTALDLPRQTLIKEIGPSLLVVVTK